MKEVFDMEKFLASGLPEAYVMGTASSEEIEEVEAAASEYPAVRDHLRELQESFEAYALSTAVAPPPTVRPLVKAAVRFMSRAAMGLISPNPVPELGENSTPADYSEWLDHPDHQLPADFEDYHAYIIGVSETTTSAIVWLRDGAPLENHTAHIEKFLILEGTCEIVIGMEKHFLKAGSYLAITPDHPHYVKVTSSVACKLILQRTAA